MKYSIRKIVEKNLLLAIVAGAVIQPVQAQTSGTAGMGTQAYGSYSTGAQATSLPGYQNYSGATNPLQTPMVRGGMNYANTSTLAPASVDMSTLPSGAFRYGFNQSAIQRAFKGVSGAASGAMLPTTATTSYDINTCDLPFIQAPNEYCEGSGGFVNLAAAGSLAASSLLNSTGGVGTTAAAPQSSAASTQEKVQGLQNYFNNP